LLGDRVARQLEDESWVLGNLESVLNNLETGQIEYNFNYDDSSRETATAAQAQKIFDICRPQIEQHRQFQQPANKQTECETELDILGSGMQELAGGKRRANKRKQQPAV
jgi:hypothetical protein